MRGDVFMKTIYLMLVMCLFVAAGAAQDQSRGDVARANRAKKHTSASAIKLDDESVARTATNTSSDADTAKKVDDKKTDDKTADAKDADKASPADAQKKKDDDIKKQIDAQTKEIAILQRELDVATREARLRAAAYYGDAGTQLRDQAKYAEDTRKEQDEINTKKQALDAAQQKLSDLQEQARKAGIKTE